MSSKFMKVSLGMPKIVGLLCCGPASLLIGIQGCKIHRNYYSEGETSKGQSGAHKAGILEKLTEGPNPAIGNISEQQLDRIIKTNSVWSGSSEYLREKRRDALGEGAEDSVLTRTRSLKFKPQVEEGTVLKRTRSMKDHIA